MPDIRFPEVNRVILSGRLTAAPELRYTPSGAAVCSMRLASNRSYRNAQSNEYEQETTFLAVVAWQKLAEVCSEHLDKGSSVLVEGRLRSRAWTDQKSGQNRTVLELHAEQVQFLSKRENGKSEGEEEREPETEEAAASPF